MIIVFLKDFCFESVLPFTLRSKKILPEFIYDLIGTPHRSCPSHTTSGTPAWWRSGWRCPHSRRTRTACIPLSAGGSTTAEHSLNRPLPTSAPCSGLLQRLHER